MVQRNSVEQYQKKSDTVKEQDKYNKYWNCENFPLIILNHLIKS